MLTAGGVPFLFKTEHIREKYGNDIQIRVIYEDQPVNDFKSLFLRTHGESATLNIKQGIPI